MTKEEALLELNQLSHGTLAGLLNTLNIDELDDILASKCDLVREGKVDVSKCESWIDVWEVIVKVERVLNK